MDLSSFGHTILLTITNIHNLTIGFWILVALVVFISFILISNFRSYGENYLIGFLFYTFYGFGVFTLLTNIYGQLQIIASL